MTADRPEAPCCPPALAGIRVVEMGHVRPGVMERLGFGYESCRALNPGLVYASISGFGATGPLREQGGYDLVAQAMSGIMSVTGDAEGPPEKAGVPVTDVGAALYAALGIVAARRGGPAPRGGRRASG